jgi:DNA-binding NtrC family response regulator
MGCTSVLQAADGGEAQSALERSVDDLDLVVCDWIMPQLTGLHLLNWTRNRKPDLPFMIVTGMNEVTSVVDAVASGVTGYVLKPFGPDRLEEKVCEILKR